jgi:F0F1-type ATP synthase assembly protein I
VTAKRRQKNFWVLAGEYTSLAFLLPAGTFVGYGIGYLLDRALGTGFLKVVFLILGTVSGFVEVIRQVQKDSGDSDDG